LYALKMMDKIESVLRKVLEIEQDQSLADLSLGTWKNWDSLATMQIVIALEETLEIRFLSSEISQFVSYEDIVRVISER